MITQLLKILTPELILKAVKENPVLVMESLQKFDTVKLIGKALNIEQQIVLSNNGALVNNFLESPTGSSAISMIAEEFTTFVKETKQRVEDKIIAESRASIEESVRLESEESIRKEILDKIRKEIEDKVRAELAAKSSSRALENVKSNTTALLNAA